MALLSDISGPQCTHVSAVSRLLVTVQYCTNGDYMDRAKVIL